MDRVRYVRGRGQLLPAYGLDYFGHSLESIRAWREQRQQSLEEFFRVYHLCYLCKAEGVRVADWVLPKTPEENQAAADLNLKQLPIYETCDVCGGTGKR